jgi:hypothetical protein
MLRPLIRIIGLPLVISLGACSHTALLTKQDYQKSQQDFMQGNADDAFLDFPRGAENGDFITTMEKAYLNLIQGKPQLKQLRQQVDQIENRVRYHVTREAKTFFYLQTPEDYYASEHEVIWLHFLLSWAYSLQGQYENACVEARVASSLLSLPWSPNGHFDDPAMRLFLAGLWTMCGEWREAQVDLRAASDLDPHLTWARDLAARQSAPANLIIILGGPGPEPLWTPEMAFNPLRSSRQISFKLRGKKSTLRLSDRSGFNLVPYLSPDASNWYQRQLERESELHELILDSAFGGKATASGALASGKIAAKTGLGVLIGVAGTALGVAIANAGAKSGSNDSVKFGLITIAASLSWGGNYIAEGYRNSINEFKQDVDPSNNYRFVRYLPEYLWMGWSDQAINYPLQVSASSGARSTIKQPTVIGNTTVTLGFIPDSSTYFYPRW